VFHFISYENLTLIGIFMGILAGFSYALIRNSRRYAGEHTARLEDANRMLQEEIVDRKQAEHQLVLLSNALNYSHDAAFLIDDMHRFIYVNDMACLSLGYSREELLTMGVPDIDPDLSDEALARIMEYTHTVGASRIESRHRTKDGRIFPVEVTCTVFEHEGKHYDLTLVRDISERKQSEQQIKLLNHALDQVREGAFLISGEGTFLYVNKEACRSLEYSRDELLTMGIQDIDLDFSPQRMTECFADLVRHESHTFESRHRCKTGRTFPVEITSTLLEYGNSRHTLALVRDISERKQAEDKLRESEKTFRTMAENSPDNIIRYDSSAQVIYFNPQIQRTLGRATDHLIGKTPLEDLGEPFREYQRKIEQVIITGKEDNIDIFMPDRGEGERHHHIRFVAEQSPDGSITGVLAIGRDITDRKHAEEERTVNLRFFENMDRINLAIQSAHNFEQMMSNVLDTMLSIFECDRAFLLQPCDPEAAFWQVPMERTRPEYRGAGTLYGDIPMTADIAEKFHILLACDGPVQFGPDCHYLLSPELAERFRIKSIMSMALHLKTGISWELGIQHCSSPKNWNVSEENLFRGIGRRLADGLTSMLMYRDLQESEKRHRVVFEYSPVSIWEEDFSQVKLLFDDLRSNGVSDIERQFDSQPELVQECAELVRIIDVNRAALTLHGAESKEELLSCLSQTFTPESYTTFRQELVCIWQGKTGMNADAVVKTLKGELRHVTVCFTVCPGYEETLASCLVSLIDITERTRAEETIREKERHVSNLALKLTLSEERERRRIATDLHDTLGQDLALARIRLGTFIKGDHTDGQPEKCGEIMELLESAISRVRKLTRLVCPPILEGSGLEAALKWLGRQIESDYDLLVEFQDDLQDKPVLREYQMEIYNSVRELLINVAKHANAGTILLTLSRETDKLVIRIEDDGVGFSPATVLGKPDLDGFGLHNIRYRIVHLGGSFDIDSAPGAGVRATIRVPTLL
jgi:PAS domain S-box-containing protein